MTRAIVTLVAATLTLAGAGADAAGFSSRGGLASLNPQPLPPRWTSPFASRMSLGRGGAAMLNPQPLPPRWRSFLR